VAMVPIMIEGDHMNGSIRDCPVRFSFSSIPFIIIGDSLSWFPLNFFIMSFPDGSSVMVFERHSGFLFFSNVILSAFMWCILLIFMIITSHNSLLI